MLDGGGACAITWTLMRREPDFFGDQDLELVYIAKRLRDAKAIEELLTASSVDYLVEPDAYIGGVIFRGERIGAFFYVLGQDSGRVRMLLAQNGHAPVESD
jgi:hypothetical protein